MKRLLLATALVAASPAFADGNLNIFNWGNYTSPEMIKKFEDKYNVKVTITDYDSNDTALAKVAAGGAGFDIVVPSNSFVPIWVEKGLLADLNPADFSNWGNIAPEWQDVPWDPKRAHTVPWQWGSTGVAVNKTAYSGDPNTSAIFMDPPPELVGKVNVVPEMNDVMSLALMYVGGEPCTEDTAVLKKARDALMAAKPKWRSMDYGMTEKMSSNDVVASVNWNGSTMRVRQANPDVVYGYPKEGYPMWMDSVAILKDAPNPENAKLFVNFILDPENAAMISAFAKYANGVSGSDQYMPEEMKTAPEIVVPAADKSAGHFLPTCSAKAQEYYTAIWTELQK